jgi:CheY-like chemotaxis protein
VVFLTGGAFSETLQRKLETLGNVVLRKPFSQDDLRSAIARVSAEA